MESQELHQDSQAKLLKSRSRRFQRIQYQAGLATRLGVAWALIQAGAKPAGFDLYVESDVPVGAGLSSSAAIECSVAMALNELWGANLDRSALAKIGQKAENEIVGAPTGIMDQTASLFGSVDHVVFLDCRSLAAEAIPLGLQQKLT
jgi:galactokinase